MQCLSPCSHQMKLHFFVSLVYESLISSAMGAVYVCVICFRCAQKGSRSHLEKINKAEQRKEMALALLTPDLLANHPSVGYAPFLSRLPNIYNYCLCILRNCQP